ncbi:MULTISPECIES: RICIN domain-containing protein [unclassified Streptomyces]|uniref:RICIN domain-containing protein n=1 Tax=unclassified Streptomyces TaxID=2593676 RepID=UPI00364441A1
MARKLARTAGYFLASIAITLGLTSSVEAAPKGPESSRAVWGYIKNVNSGLCLEIRGDSTANGATANQWECNGSDTQKWALTSINQWDYTIENKNSGKCLEIRGDSTANGATANQWECNGSTTQQWELQVTTYPVVWNRNSGKCLEILSWGAGNGDLAGQWDCHGGNNQRWTFPVA